MDMSDTAGWDIMDTDKVGDCGLIAEGDGG